MALSILAGLVVGIVYRQPTIGVLAGTVVGILTAILVWVANRRA